MAPPGAKPPPPEYRDDELLALVKDAVWLERLGYRDALDGMSFAGVAFRALLEAERRNLDVVQSAEAGRAAQADEEDYGRWVDARFGRGNRR